jgi:hypothetical protein
MMTDRISSTRRHESSEPTMTDDLDDQYLEWLYSLVGLQEENVYHNRMMMRLLSTEFVMLVPNDDNRCVDGIVLRKEFTRIGRMIKPNQNWMDMGCSVLEMMIGVARHLSFTAEGEVGEWFWHLIQNLGLTRYNDRRYSERRVDEITERLVWRQYSYDGNGGLFPLQEPHEDQRHVELWFQMEAYILELS